MENMGNYQHLKAKKMGINYDQCNQGKFINCYLVRIYAKTSLR